MKRLLVVSSLAVIVLFGCGGGSSPPRPTPRCVHSSECSGLLACVQGYCINACDKSKDCLNGARCIKTDEGNYCQPEERRTCVLNSECTTPLVCGVDRQCRNQCAEDRDCLSGQVCTSMTKLCADPSVDKNYDPVTNDFKTTEGGGAAGPGDGAAGDGAVAGTAGGAGAGGGAGTGAPSCPNGQTQFNDVAEGDANPSFTSGVGVRNAKSFYVFSGYAGPAPTDGGAEAGSDAAVPTVNAVYVQSFDVVGGAKRGAPRQLLTTTDGQFFFVHDVSIAPTGEIALLYGHASPTDGRQSALFIAFLTSGAAGDGGVGDVELKKVQQIETVPLGSPHVVWSHEKQTFVVSWKYLTTNWFTRIRTFSPTGSSSGGLNVVPTAAGFDNDQNTEDARVGLSGPLYGAIHRDFGTGHPLLTILDENEQQLGPILELSMVNMGWGAAGGTKNGFLALYNSGPTVYGTWVPAPGTSSPSDGGAPDAADAGDGGAPDAAAPTYATFSFPSTARSAQAVSDDPASSGGTGAVLLEPNGANFVFVTADGSRHSVTGTVLTSANSAQAAISNYRGSFAISLYDSVRHSTQVIASGCQ
jgi:hypothetical protein